MLICLALICLSVFVVVNSWNNSSTIHSTFSKHTALAATICKKLYKLQPDTRLIITKILQNPIWREWEQTSHDSESFEIVNNQISFPYQHNGIERTYWELRTVAQIIAKFIKVYSNQYYFRGKLKINRVRRKNYNHYEQCVS